MGRGYKIKWKLLLLVGAFFLVWFSWWFALPQKLFKQPYATVLFSESGELLSARIAADEQWRFPPMDTLPDRYKKALVLFEDERFYQHSGIDFSAIIRAVYQNVKEGKIVSGASTITMQTVRLAKENPPRTCWQKCVEMFLALRLEVDLNKKQILQAYAAHAPFGGNIVGIEAACWRYFGRPPHKISWAEAAMLAVLPNAPGLMYPGKSNNKLRDKRNRLLKKLMEKGNMDSLSYQLAMLEPLPQKVKYFQDQAAHAIQHQIKKGKSQQRIHSTIQAKYQQKAGSILQRYHQLYKQNMVGNAAMVVVDNKTQEVIVYQGNVPNVDKAYEGYNDMAQTPRSTGSILKPFLFAMLMQQGIITPYSIQKDIPMMLGKYTPQNYVSRFEGMVPANVAIARSLNVPAIKMLQQLTVPNFLHQLRKFQISTMPFGADHYGLSIILGGAEATLWELTQAYSLFAQQLNNTIPKSAVLDKNDLQQNIPFDMDKSVCWSTMQTMKNVVRPSTEIGWNFFENQRKIAWKTGTSFGGRDAWAIGVDKNYTVGVWVGNADGEGRPQLSGATYAGPLLFEMFHHLPKSTWFDKPEMDIRKIKLCANSGFIAGVDCPFVLKEVPKTVLETTVCNCCKKILVHADTKKRINMACSNVEKREIQTFFELPPVVTWYYKKTHPDYVSIPAWELSCMETINKQEISLIYPYKHSKIKIPRDVNGNKQKLVIQAAHAQNNAILYWHINEQFIETTDVVHNVELDLQPGTHVLTILDDNGSVLTRNLEVLE